MSTTTKATKAKASARPAASKSSGAPTTPMGAGTAPAAKTARPTVVDAPQSVILGPVMRKKELLETVVERSGVKKKDAKPVVDSILAILGEALADNRELILPPFGRVKVRREKVMSNGRMMVVKVRQSTGTPGGKAGKDDDDSDDGSDDD